MKHLPMSCECCEVYEVGEQRNGRYWSRVFRVNGTRYVGLESVGSAFGLTGHQAKGRIARGTCLRISWHDAMAQRTGRRKKRYGPDSDELAQRFCRVMARAVPRETSRSSKRRPRTALISYAAQRKIAEREGRG